GGCAGGVCWCGPPRCERAGVGAAADAAAVDVAAPLAAPALPVVPGFGAAPLLGAAANSLGGTKRNWPAPAAAPAAAAAPWPPFQAEYWRCTSAEASPGLMAVSSASPGSVKRLPARNIFMLPSKAAGLAR